MPRQTRPPDLHPCTEAAPPPDRPQHLLFVSGNGLFRRLMLPGLAEQGIQITMAAGAVAALRLRQSGAPCDLLLADIDLADMDALAFARTIRAGGAWAGCRLLAMSVCPLPARRAVELAAGFASHVSVFANPLLLAMEATR